MSRKYKSVPVDPTEITPEEVYLSRRDILKSLGIVTASAALLAACGPNLPETQAVNSGSTAEGNQAPTSQPEVEGLSDEFGDPANEYGEITNYNNYYEFSTDKQRVSRLAADFKSSPWDLQVDGLVKNPMTFSIEDLLAQFPQEERIYRLRCVEAWSMVIPWLGVPLGSILAGFQPTSKAKYVAFKTLHDPVRMPGQQRAVLNWPYREGLTIAEAMHPLTLLAVGMYGKTLPNQNGA
ncbi:MAG TPA: protein-methionine-sulfoxide reductase catalytic subunit MsrP, partial [Chloroflexi bacterium]|nr:protein-methionine-sulfoxide reductase catalytic subunit MsrP [Chloroflexota bacterium]